MDAFFAAIEDPQSPLAIDGTHLAVSNGNHVFILALDKMSKALMNDTLEESDRLLVFDVLSRSSDLRQVFAIWDTLSTVRNTTTIDSYFMMSISMKIDNHC